MKNLISVIIPFYKKRKYFIKTINSLKNQTYKNFEAIVIYDDPNKSDLKFVKKILKRIKYRKILINNTNIGVGFSRNEGIKKSKGALIAFLDADDVWHRNKLELQLKFMKLKKINFSYTSYQIIDNSKKIIKKIIVPKEINYKKLLYSCDIGLSSVMMSRNLLNKNKFKNLKTKEDYLLWLILSKKGIKMLGLNQVLFSWRKTQGSLSSSTKQKLKDAFRMYNKHLKFSFLKSIFLTILLSINFIFKRYL
jgi:teichuronic acid biosynthesis glycosyltransferase TuaG